MKPFPAKRRISPSFFFRVHLVIAVLMLSACSSLSKRPIHPPLPDRQEGYAEFYCVRCMTGFAVFERDENKETHLAQQMLGRRLQDSVEMPSRIKRVRIALPAGTHDLVIRLLPLTLVDTLFHVEKGSSKPLRLIVIPNKLTPVRLDFARINTNSFKWELKQGALVPLNENDDTIETLTIFLQSSDWDTRWYAAQFFSQTEGDLPKLALMRLETLAGWPELQNCLKKASVVECETLREEASKTLRQIERKR